MTYDGVHPNSKAYKIMADTLKKKIDISDGIYVLNIDGYIGESVCKEIEYAQLHGKEVVYHCK